MGDERKLDESRLKSTAHALRSLASAPENDRKEHVPNFLGRDACLDVAAAIDAALSASAPIPMRLVCEGCGKLHIDEPPFDTKPHHTHSCQHCGITWRPAVVNTVGVQFLPGFRNEDHAKKKPDRVVELGRRVAELEAAAVEELPAGWRCRLCGAEVMSEDGTDPVLHEPKCPLYTERA